MKIRGNTVGTTMKPEKVVEKAGGFDLSNYYTKDQVDHKLQQYVSPMISTIQSHDESITVLNGEVGDISTALDSIIAIQDELIGNTPEEEVLITFKVGRASCTAVQGMSWSEWIDSDYNTVAAYVIDGTNITYEEDSALQLYSHNTDLYVVPSDIIEDGVSYSWL